MTIRRRAPAASITNGSLNSFAQPRDRERTPWLLAFLCLIIPLLPSYVVLIGNLNLSPPRMISIGLLGLTILGFLVVVRRTERIQTVKPGVILILVYFLLELSAFVIEPSNAESTIVGRGRLLTFTLLLATMGIALYTMTRITTTRQRSILLGVLAVGLTFLCAVGILQNYMNIDLRLLFEPPGFREVHQLGEVVNVATLERFNAKRSFSTSDHAAEFSALAAVTVPLTIHFARYAATSLTRLLAVVATGFALIGVLAGASRGGLVALAAALLVYIWAFRLRNLIVVVVVAAALFAGIAALIGSAAVSRSAQGLWTAVTEGASLEDSSVAARVERYAAVSQVFHDHPLFGLGVGRFPPGIVVLDNQWLKALVEGGIVGVTAMMVLAGGGLFGIAAALRRAATPRERDQAYAMGAIFTGILATSFTFDLFYFSQVTLVFFLVFGLLWSTYTISIPE
jgi:polysaccharide biosynthesis protein PslJ